MDQGKLRKAIEGSREARACLLRELQDPWFRVCVALLRDRDLAAEAVQESAVRLLRDLPSFQGRSAFRTWAVGIAVNVVREMKRQRSRGEEREWRTEESASSAADDVVARDEERGALLEALELLSERQREAVVLRYFEGMSVEQTAESMRCSPGTVKATVWQALRALKKRLSRLAVL